MKSVDPSVYNSFSLPFSAGEEEILGMAMFSGLSPEEQQYIGSVPFLELVRLNKAQTVVTGPSLHSSWRDQPLIVAVREAINANAW